jgi:hypothetical protein
MATYWSKDQCREAVPEPKTETDIRRDRHDLHAHPDRASVAFGVVRLARGLRYKNWAMVAEFMQILEPVWVATTQDALDLQDEIRKIPGAKSTRRQDDGQWKVIRTR